MSPTSLTLRECKRRGWDCDIVERRITRTIKRDFLGVIDIIAVSPSGAVGIQVTSGSNHAARVAKVLAEPRMRGWVASGQYVAVWSWSKRGARGKRKTWQLREQDLTMDVVIP